MSKHGDTQHHNNQHSDHEHSADEHSADESTIAPESVTRDVAILSLENVNVEASWGHIYGPVSLEIQRGGVTVLVGQGGRGRTALLLTLAGRMKPSTGSITSFGQTNAPHDLFTRANVGFISEVDAIPQAIRVRDIVTEQLRWGDKWFKWVPPATDADLEALCRPVFGDLELPHLESMVEELPELTAALFRIAAANARRPEILVVGGIDNLTSNHGSVMLLERLVELGNEQTIITADVNGKRTDLDVRAYLDVPNLTNHEFVDAQPSTGGTDK
ncbi:ATP-binding cassette domain-containing protein [Lysinibacter cavernae]|uniref:ABC-type cobalamin/Fe3+-siderophores transport system ATPase subunit n=1 Tax=Lysinibacter cavernae TaxID=1640652 RepID=A0A7X5TSG2_9MICO|nr:ATP-binding cassette domain-containing protein [Lysinibacter cavernae]NIH52960.1 ABC-type cobalamin/Fe3+-siderophores transport system ATPase subunit [Lysinibacter cavernae]